MLTSGDVVDVELGVPDGREADIRHPAVAVTAQRILDAEPSVVQVVPLTSTVRAFGSEVAVEADRAHGLDHDSAAQCQHVRAVSAGRIVRSRGDVGDVALRRVREVLALILDLPAV